MRAANTSFSGKSILSLIMVLLLCTPALALTPEVSSVEPDRGANDSPTAITIHGNNFEATPRVALYGGGMHVTGSTDTPGLASGVHISGNYAYVAAGDSGLQIVDITDPTNPTIVGSEDTPGISKGVSVSGNYAYLAEESVYYVGGGLVIVDITDPTNPTVVASALVGEDAYGIFISNNYAYVAGGGIGSCDSTHNRSHKPCRCWRSLYARCFCK